MQRHAFLNTLSVRILYTVETHPQHTPEEPCSLFNTAAATRVREFRVHDAVPGAPSAALPGIMKPSNAEVTGTEFPSSARIVAIRWKAPS